MMIVGDIDAAPIIQIAVKEDEVVGRRQGGVLCVPSGGLALSELERPSVTQAAAMIRTETENYPELRNVGLRAVITDISLSLCIAGKTGRILSGIGVMKSKPKGKIKIEVNWLLYSENGKQNNHESCNTFVKYKYKGSDPRYTSQPLLGAVRLSLMESLDCLRATTARR